MEDNELDTLIEIAEIMLIGIGTIFFLVLGYAVATGSITINPTIDPSDYTQAGN